MFRMPTYPQYRQHGKSSSETRKAIDHYSYALNEEIGRGFSSKVYKGRDETNQEPVAVKVIDMKMVKQSIHSTLLKNEINALKQFNSKNIMKLYDVFQTQNNTYIITEYCDSGDLAGFIKRRGRIDEQEAIRILSQVVLALYEINKRGFIHRDIKPANILLDKNTPKIADFGFAVPHAEARAQGKNFNVGTPLYMSPQALRQQGHTEKGDVWAVGVMYFEMLYGKFEFQAKGRTPYNAQSEAALISNILHQPLNIPSVPAVSDLSKDFIRKCLQVDDSRRIRVKDMATHQIISQRCQTPVERVERVSNPRQPLKEIIPTQPTQPTTSNVPTPQNQKFKRSQSQGVKEIQQKDYKSQQPRKEKEAKESKENDKKKPQPAVQRSASQQNNMQQIKQQVKTSAFDDQALPPQQLQRQKTISQEFKLNNEILFSQINFCRFLYKFSQSLASSKILQQDLRDKALFLMGKNIAIKISKLTTIVEKENRSQNTSSNLYQLDDYDNYRRSESHNKFSQAIMEYYEKYLRHFDKILKLSQKNDFSKDPIIGGFCNGDLSETEVFYRTAQTFLKICLQDLKQAFKSLNVTKLSLDAVLPDDLQLPAFLYQGLNGYLVLSQKVIENMTDYRTFQKVSQSELLIERKPASITFGQLESLMVQI